MKLAQNETEARVLRDIAHSWVRLANQIDRYTALAKSNGPHRAKECRVDERSLLLVRKSNSVLRTNDFAKRTDRRRPA
jgi:hypothetical protein